MIAISVVPSFARYGSMSRARRSARTKQPLSRSRSLFGQRRVPWRTPFVRS
jgi:hypothetical protein